MPSGKFHSLVGMQDTEKAMKLARLMADERKRLSPLTNWKPQGHSVLQVVTAHFLFRPLFLCVLLRVQSLIKSVGLVRFREGGGGVCP